MAIPRYQSSTTSAPAASIGVMRPVNFAGAMDAATQPLTQLAREIGADAEAADAQQQQLIGYAEMKLDENGNPTVEMTAGMTPGQRAYNAGAMAAYDAHFKDSVAQKTIELQEKHKHDPESFKAEFQAYRDGVTSEIGDKRFRGRADIIMAQHQTMTYAAITAKKAERDHALGGKANAAHLERVSNNLVSMASTGGMAANGEMITPAGQLLAEDFRESQQAAIKAGYLTPEQVQLMNDNMAVRQQGAYVGYMTKAVINEMRAKGASANQIYAKAFELMSSHADRLQKDAPERFSTEQMAQLKEHMKAQVSLTLAEVQQKDIAIKAAEEKAAQSELLKLQIELSDRHAANDIPGIASVTDKLRAATQRHGEAGAKFLGALNQGRALMKAHENEQARELDAKNKEAAKKATQIVNEVFSGSVSAETRAILDGVSESGNELQVDESNAPVTLDVNEDMPQTLTEKIAQKLGMGPEQTAKLISASRSGLDVKEIASALRVVERLTEGPDKKTATDNLVKLLNARTEAFYSALTKQTQEQEKSFAKTENFKRWLSGDSLIPVDSAVEGFEESLKLDTLKLSLKDPAEAPRVVELMQRFGRSTPSIDAMFNAVSPDSVRLARAYRDAAPEKIGSATIPAWRHIARSEVYDAILREYEMQGTSIDEQIAAGPNPTEDQKRKKLVAENDRIGRAIANVSKLEAYSATPAGKQAAMDLDDPAQIAAAADVRGFFGRTLSAIGDLATTVNLTPIGGVASTKSALRTITGNDINIADFNPALIADYKQGYIRARQLNPNGTESDWQDSARTFVTKQQWGLTEYPANGKKTFVKNPIEKSTPLLDFELREQVFAFVVGALNSRGRVGWEYQPQIISDLNPDELRSKIVDRGEFSARWVGSGYELYLSMDGGPPMPVGDPLKPAVFMPKAKDSVGDAIVRFAAKAQKVTNIGGDSPSWLARGASNIASTLVAKTTGAALTGAASAANALGFGKDLTSDSGAKAIEAQAKAGRDYWLQRNKP